jgi:hypothetical protein
MEYRASIEFRSLMESKEYRVNVMETKNVARRWVEENAQEMPGFRAAHLVGGITAMDDRAPFPQSKDVDLHLIFEDGSPMLGQRGPLPNILEVSVDGLALEMGIKPVSDYATPEIVLANPELAFHFTVDSALYDPEGWLANLSREVMPRYADREWVDRRMEHEQRGFDGMLGLRPLANQLLGPSGELSMLGYGSTFLAGALSVAALRPPKIGGRVFVTVRGYLQELDRLDLHERLLAIYGLDRLSTPESQELLAETARFFDLMLVRKRAPHPFDHKLHPHLRPYLVDTCQQMIADGYPREAASWMLPYFLATTDVLKAEGTEQERRWTAQRQERFLSERRFDDPVMRDARFEELTQLAGEIFALCSGMIERNPAIRQLAFAY